MSRLLLLYLFSGAGGTQRLPRFLSIPNALDLMLTGKSLRADKAKNMGVVNLLVDPLGPGLHEPGDNTMRYLEEVAIGIAKDLAAGKIKAEKKVTLQDKILSYALQYNWVKDQIFGKAKAQVMKMSQGLYPAPLRVCTHYFHVHIVRT